MLPNTQKQTAIALRKKGKTYSEILKVVPVAKSTLSLWLREVGLSTKQKQKISQKKLLSAKRGGEAKRKQRVDRSTELFSHSRLEIGKLSKRELFLIGVALYWAEGSKQKEHNVSQPVVFGNSDGNMVRLFMKWLGAIGIKRESLYFELYIHANGDTQKAVAYWSKIVGCSVESLKKKTYMKAGNPGSYRRNKGEKYVGLLRVRVKESTDLNRKIGGWIQGVVEN